MATVGEGKHLGVSQRLVTHERRHLTHRSRTCNLKDGIRHRILVRSPDMPASGIRRDWRGVGDRDGILEAREEGEVVLGIAEAADLVI